MNFGNGITEILAVRKVKCLKEVLERKLSVATKLPKLGGKKKKKEFNYLGNEVAENEPLAKKKMIINMTDAHLLYISVVHRT